MPMYEVTLAGNIKANHQDYVAGEQLTVDAELYAELVEHDLVTNVREIEDEKPTARKTKTTVIEGGE